MPLYEYKCHSCGKTFEVIQKFADEPLKTHPECGGEVERLMSAPAFHLKGKGWYVTDYGKGNGGRAGELKSSEKHSGGASSEPSKSETKSESGSSSESTPAESKSESKPAASESKPAASDSKPAPSSSSSSSS
jgi:putative FmdB family regulatory protein